MSEFNLSDNTNPFHKVIKEHNAKRVFLQSLRQTFRKYAEGLADFFLTYPQSPKWVGHWRAQRDALVLCFEHKTSQGHGGVFQPWDGWWKGVWNSPNKAPIPQFHVWDETVKVEQQHVQPVTQSVSQFVHRENLMEANKGEESGKAKVDLGINVWAPDMGITGWVSKRQYGKEELPHIGYTPNGHTLIWITQVNYEGAYYMYFEWSDPATNRYGIHGRAFQIINNKLIRGSVTGWTEYDTVTPQR
jgi:hypothetical protein